MRTIALTTTAALAALMLATPTFTPPAEAAKVRVNGKVKPRIRVRPQIKVRINKKRLIRKAATPANQRQQVPEGKQPQNRTTTITTSPGKTPAQRFSTIDPYGSVADAVQDAMERFGAGDLGNFDAEDIIGLDRFVVGLGLGGDVLGGDEDEGDINDEIAGLQPPGGGTGSMFDPNDVLPGNDNRPDTGHLDVNVDDARSGITHGGGRPRLVGSHHSGLGRGDGYLYRTIVSFYSDGTHINHERIVETDTGAVYEWQEGYDKNNQLIWRRGNPPPGHPLVEDSEELPSVDPAPDDGKQAADNGKDPAKLYDPEYTDGGEVIPVNCGSVACNEARNGKGPGLGKNPTTHVLPADPAEETGGTVGNAPYTGKYWRDVATTNPGSDPQDQGGGSERNNVTPQVLVIDDGTGPKPPTVPGK